MAIENENGSGMVMPVQPMGYGGNYGGGYGYPMAYPVMPMYGGYGGGMGGFGGDWSALIVLFLFAAMFGGFGGGWGMGGFGGFDGGAFPWLLASNANNQNATSAGFDNAALSAQISGLRSDVTGGFGDTALGIAGLSRQICETGGNVTAAITGAQNAVSQQLYNNEIASLNRSFAEQTANTAAINGVQSKLADCCCENRLATQGVQNAILTDGSATRQAIAQGIQSISDKLCQLELDGVKSDLAAERRENASLQNRLNMAAFRADNVAQTAQLVADNNAQTQYIVNRVAPYPIPAYLTGNPYGYNGYGYGNGWGNGWGNFGVFNPFGNVGFGNGSF